MRLDGGDAVFLQRVRQEPRFHAGRAALSLVQQFLKHRHHSRGTDAGFHYVLEPLVVGLGFVLTAEAGEKGAAGDVDRRAGYLAVADAGEDAGEGDADVCSLGFLHLLDRMASHDVTDFVTQHTC